MRYRVCGDSSLLTLLESGEQCKISIEESLKKINRSLDSFTDILDFGCGCGRTLLWIARSSPSRFYGSDIDADAISWCQKNLSFITFSVNDRLPPLQYPASSFNLIYAISVFTHINEEDQFCWLRELKRLMKPGGILLVTLQGRHIWGRLSQDVIDEVTKKGFYFRKTGFWKSDFPDWYEDAYHAEQYVLDIFGKYFKVIDYIPQGVGNIQDMVILQNIN